MLETLLTSKQACFQPPWLNKSAVFTLTTEHITSFFMILNQSLHIYTFFKRSICMVETHPCRVTYRLTVWCILGRTNSIFDKWTVRMGWWPLEYFINSLKEHPKCSSVVYPTAPHSFLAVLQGLIHVQLWNSIQEHRHHKENLMWSRKESLSLGCVLISQVLDSLLLQNHLLWIFWSFFVGFAFSRKHGCNLWPLWKWSGLKSHADDL